MTSLTLLMENTVYRRGLIAEHGLSVWVETEQRPLLFDAGQTDGYLCNARRLGIRVAGAEKLILSHGHYDHGDGLIWFPAPEVADAAPELYLHPDALLPRWSRTPGPGGNRHPAGVSWPPAQWKRTGIRVREVRGVTEIGPGRWLVSEIPTLQDIEPLSDRFMRERDGVEEQDPFSDEQVLVFLEEGRLSVLFGCGHPGLISTLRHVRSLWPDTALDTVAGGFHLNAAGPERLARTIAELREMDVRRVVPLHCTGPEAVCTMRQELGDRVLRMHVGDRLTL